MKSYIARLFSYQTIAVLVVLLIVAIVVADFSKLYPDSIVSGITLRVLTWPWLVESILLGLFLLQRIQRFRWALKYGQKLEKVRVRDDVRVISLDSLLEGRDDPNTKLYPEMACLCADVYPKEKHPFPGGWEDISESVASAPEARGTFLEKTGRPTEYGFKFHLYLKPADEVSAPVLALVFRGTVGLSFRSWWANFHWLTRLGPLPNHYVETGQLVPKLVAWCQQNHPGVKIVSAGHSLGGGLAQCANYLSEDIKITYAINSSPVTGFFDVPKAQRKKNVEGSKIYRLYEKGEALELIRPIAEFWYFLNPAPNNNPSYIEHRVNLREGLSVAEHSIEPMAVTLYERKQSGTRLD